MKKKRVLKAISILLLSLLLCSCAAGNSGEVGDFTLPEAPPEPATQEAATRQVTPEEKPVGPENDPRYDSLGIPDDVGTAYYTEEVRALMLEHGLDYNTVESLIDVGYVFSEMLEMTHEERKVCGFAKRFGHFDGSMEELLDYLPRTEAYIVENYPELVTKMNYGKSALGRSLDAYSLSNTSEPAQTVMLTFALHGFEGDTHNDGAFLTESAYVMMLFYAENPEFLGDTRLVFCPLVNPDGVYAEQNAGYGREQSEGIDLNRDFYTGGFRAAESLAMKELLKSVEPDVLLDFHGWLNGTYGDKELARVFETHTGLKLIDEGYGATQGYLIGYAHKKGIRSLLVEHEHFTEINARGVLYALNEICRAGQ